MLNFLGWVIFAGISWNILEMIIAACTNKYARNIAFVILIAFSIINGYLLYFLSLDRAFLLHVILFPILLVYKYRSIVQSMNSMLDLETTKSKQEAIAKLDLLLSESGVNYRGTKLMFFIAGFTYLLLLELFEHNYLIINMGYLAPKDNHHGHFLSFHSL